MVAMAMTDNGEIRGSEEDGLLVFRGIPYAAAPTGELRWQPPQPHPPWDEALEATGFGNQAPQNASPMDGLFGGSAEPAAQGEDCLFLNVWTPGTNDTQRPVMFWIHGGAFTIGAGSQPLYDGQYLAREGDVVVVTINYRMGALGFLNLKEATGGKIGATGNEGLLDQVAALEWVRDNIAAFGGDPTNVTIFGESAGGMSVGCLLAMPSAEGLFHKAIPQSGACHTALSKSEALRVAETVMELLETDDPDALMELPEATLTEVQTKLSAIASERGLPGMSFQPVIDGEVLPAMPIECVRAGSAAGIAIMAGCTTEEWKLFSGLDPAATNMSEEALTEAVGEIFGDLAADVIGSYRSLLADSGKGTGPGDVSAEIMTDRVFWVPAMILLEAQRAHDARTYGYLFDWKSPLMGGAMGACHAVELGFVWGTYDKNGGGTFFGEGAEADALSEFTQDAWIRFAHTGHPGGGSGPAWPSYDSERRATMVFSSSPEVVMDPADAIRTLWTGVPESSLGTL